MNMGHQILLLLKTVMTQANEDKSQLNMIVSELGWHQLMPIQLFSHFLLKSITQLLIAFYTNFS